MIKILVVDDSAFMRKVLSDLFKSQPDFEVVDIGRNGAEAVEKVKQHSPDVYVPQALHGAYRSMIVAIQLNPVCCTPPESLHCF